MFQLKYAIGVDIGGGTIRSGLVNEKGKVIKFKIIDTERGKGKKEVMKNLIQAITLVFPKNKKVNDNLRFIDLFAGIGGFHIAFHNAGAECVFVSEWDEPAQKTYRHNLYKVSPEMFD